MFEMNFPRRQLLCTYFYTKCVQSSCLLGKQFHANNFPKELKYRTNWRWISGI